jgi:hypothetical protein
MKLRSSRFWTRLLLTSVLIAGFFSRGGVFAAAAPSVEVTDKAQIHKTEVNGFVHPGIGLTKEMLEDARSQVLAKREPWYSGFLKFAASPSAAKTVSNRNQSKEDPARPEVDASVRWLPSFGATAYDLLRSTTSGSGYAALASNLSTAKTSYVDTTAAAGTTYYYVVRAKNSAGTSGNSPQFYGSLLPAPMVNLAFSGTSTASFNQNSDMEGSAKAFDSDPATKWYGWNSPTGWLQYDFGSGNAQVVKRYTINSADVADRDPKSWNLLGSHDATKWTPLDSQTNQSFVTRMGINAYDIGNTTAYRYYRLDITANNGATGAAVAELGLWATAVNPFRMARP